MTIRLNKFLADLGLASRRKADALIEEGKVMLNHQKAKLGDKVDPSKDEVVFEGKKINSNDREKPEYWVLHKPKFVLSAVSDEEKRRTAVDYFKNKTSARIFPVGRLDYESEGLLILTNDGELTQRLTHPKYEVPKIYKVYVEGIFSPSKIERLLSGIRLREGYTSFDEVEVLEREGRDFVLKVVIHQGHKHEIRRLCAKVGWEVTRLLRTSIADVVNLDLAAGNVRRLTDQEVAALKKLVKLDNSAE
jgi:23S rRNA pseudouridine2605 synthase